MGLRIASDARASTEAFEESAEVLRRERVRYILEEIDEQIARASAVGQWFIDYDFYENESQLTIDDVAAQESAAGYDTDVFWSEASQTMAVTFNWSDNKK